MSGARAALAVLGIALASAAAAACSDDAANEAPDGGTAPEEDAAAPEDAGVPPAADASEAAAPQGDGGPGFCASLPSQPRFCDDFDDGELEDDWTVVNATPPTDTNVDLALDARSAPYAFFGEVDPQPAGGFANASVRKTVPGAFTRGKLSFAVKLPSLDVGLGDVSIATFDVAGDHFFTLHLRDVDLATPGPSLEESHPSGTKHIALSALPPAGAWTRIVVDLDLAAGKASVDFGGTKVLDGAAIAAEPGTAAVVRVGAVYVEGPTNVFRVLVDDVVYDAQ